MVRILRHHFWIAKVALIGICAVLAGRAVSEVVAAQLAPVAAYRSPRLTHQTPPPAPVEKDADAVVARHIFCATCGPAPAPALTDELVADGAPPHTQLPLTLLATAVVTNNDNFSSATIANSATLRAGAYFSREEIPDVGPIVAIYPRYVDFENKGAGRVERLDLIAAAPVPAPETPPPTAAVPKNELNAAFAKGVRKLDEGHFQVDRALFNEVLADPSKLAKTARAMPGKDGVRIMSIRPGSPAEQLGFKNGDVVRRVNGLEVGGVDSLLAAYGQLKSAAQFSIEITRRGKTETLDYSIR